LPLRISAGFFAFVFWLPSLAVGDLVIGLLPASSASSHAAGNLAYGVVGAVLIAPAFATLTRGPERKIAPLQQIALVVVALACAAVASDSAIGIAGAAVVLVPLLVVVALHPGRRDVLRRPRRPKGSAARPRSPGGRAGARLRMENRCERKSGHAARGFVRLRTDRLICGHHHGARSHPRRVARRAPATRLARFGDMYGHRRVPLRDRFDHQSAHRRERWPRLGRGCDHLEPRLGVMTVRESRAEEKRKRG